MSFCRTSKVVVARHLLLGCAENSAAGCYASWVVTFYARSLWPAAQSSETNVTTWQPLAGSRLTLISLHVSVKCCLEPRVGRPQAERSRPGRNRGGRFVLARLGLF